MGNLWGLSPRIRPQIFAPIWRFFVGQVSVFSSINAWPFGGPGNDKLQGADEDDVLKGGGGDDDSKGKKGNDILIGGGGEDKLHGDKGEDILIAGSTIFDDNDLAAMCAIQAEWTRMDNTFQDRVENLFNGGGLRYPCAGWHHGAGLRW